MSRELLKSCTQSNLSLALAVEPEAATRASWSHGILRTSQRLKPALTDPAEHAKQGPHTLQSCWHSQLTLTHGSHSLTVHTHTHSWLTLTAHTHSPPCSQVSRGTGANAAAVLNTTTRAKNSPLTGSHILTGRGHQGLQQQACMGGSRLLWGSSRDLSEPQSWGQQHRLEPIRGGVPES